MKKHSSFFFPVLGSLSLIIWTLPFVSFAQIENRDEKPPADIYYVGRVLELTPQEEEFIQSLGSTTLVKVKIEKPKDISATIEADYNDLATPRDDLRVGDRVVLLRTSIGEETHYFVTDHYRLPSLALLLVIFFIVIIFFARFRGFTAMIGLGFSLFILLNYTVPKIVSGADPFLVAMGSVFLIAIVSLTVAHGWSRQTMIALASTLITLVLSLGLSQWFVTWSKLFGMGSEDALLLQFSSIGPVDLRGLLLAGIVIGVLGVLDDVTTAQTAAVKEIQKAGDAKGFKDLFQRGSAVGKEHIVSLVNTLALAYAGVSLPLLLAFSHNEGSVPLWTVLNSEMISEEVVRALIGSTVLTLAVPISTVIAAFYYGRRPHHAKTQEKQT